MERLFVLVRHGQSEGNARNLFTGRHDAALTETGIEEARAAGRALRDAHIRFDAAFTSPLTRARRTCALILEETGQTSLNATDAEALAERDCGEITGLAFDEVCARWGREQVDLWTRSYDGAPPGGESFRDVVARILPFYVTEILPRVMRGERVLVAGHNNALRALVFAVDGLQVKEMSGLRLPNAAPLLYRLNGDTSINEKRLL